MTTNIVSTEIKKIKKRQISPTIEQQRRAIVNKTREVPTQLSDANDINKAFVNGEHSINFNCSENIDSYMNFFFNVESTSEFSNVTTAAVRGR